VKILHIAPRYYPRIGGVEKCVKTLAEAFSKRHDVTVLTTQNEPIQTEEIINGVRVIRVLAFSPKQAYHLPIGMVHALKHIEKDLIHIHNFHSLTFLSCLPIIRETPVVASPYYHGFGHTILRDRLHFFYRPLGRRVLSGASSVVCLSATEKTLVCNKLGQAPHKVTVIPPILPELQPVCKAGNRMIVSVGRLEQYKGHQYAIKAMKELRDYTLMIVGDGPYRHHLQDLVHRMGLGERVSLIGSRSHAETLQIMRDSGILLLLSRRESYGLVVAEALLLGVPCLVFASSALKEWIDNKACFGIEDPSDTSNLALRIREVAATKRIRYRKMQTKSDMVEQLLNQIYTNAIEREARLGS